MDYPGIPTWIPAGFTLIEKAFSDWQSLYHQTWIFRLHFVHLCLVDLQNQFVTSLLIMMSSWLPNIFCCFSLTRTTLLLVILIILWILAVPNTIRYRQHPQHCKIRFHQLCTNLYFGHLAETMSSTDITKTIVIINHLVLVLKELNDNSYPWIIVFYCYNPAE